MSPHCELMDFCSDFLEEELKLLEHELSSQICELECVQSEVTDIKSSSYSNEFIKADKEVCSSSDCRNPLDFRLPSNLTFDSLVYDILRELYKNLSVRNSSIKCLKLDLMRLKKYLKVHKVKLRYGESQGSQFSMDVAEGHCLNYKCAKEPEDTQTCFTSTESNNENTSQPMSKIQEENRILKKCLSKMYQKLRKHILNDGDCKDVDQGQFVEEDIDFLTKVATGALDTFAQFHFNLQENIKQLQNSLSTQGGQASDDENENILSERSALQNKRLVDFSAKLSEYPDTEIIQTTAFMTCANLPMFRRTQSAKQINYVNSNKHDEKLGKNDKLKRELLFSQKQLEVFQTKIFEAIQLVYDVEMELDSDKDLVTMVTAIAEECNALRKEVGYLRKHRQDVKDSWLNLQSYILEAEKTLETNGRDVKTLKSVVKTLGHFLETSNCASLEETFLYLYSNQLEWIEKIESENSNDGSYTTECPENVFPENVCEDVRQHERPSGDLVIYKTIGTQTMFTLHPEILNSLNDNKCDISVQAEDFGSENLKRTNSLFDPDSNNLVNREIYVLHETPEETDISELNGELEKNESNENSDSESSSSIIVPIKRQELFSAIKPSQSHTVPDEEIQTEDSLDSLPVTTDDLTIVNQSLTSDSSQNEALSISDSSEADEAEERKVISLQDSHDSSLSLVQNTKSDTHDLGNYYDFKTLEQFFQFYDSNTFSRFCRAQKFSFDNFRILLPNICSPTDQPLLQVQNANSICNLTEDSILKGRKILLSFLYSLGSETLLSVERNSSSFNEENNRKLYIEQRRVPTPLSAYEAERKKIITTLKKAFGNKTGISEDIWMLLLSYIAPFTCMIGSQETMDISRFSTDEQSQCHSIYLCNQGDSTTNFNPKSIFINENILETNFVSQGIFGKIANLTTFLLFLLNESEDCTYGSNYILCKTDKPSDISSMSFSNKIFDVYIESDGESPNNVHIDCEAFFLVETDITDILTVYSKNELNSKLNTDISQLGAHAKSSESGHLRNYMLRANFKDDPKHLTFENMCLKLTKHTILRKSFEFFHIPNFSSELDVSLIAINVISIQEETNEMKVKLYPVDGNFSESTDMKDTNMDDAQNRLTPNSQLSDYDRPDSVLSQPSPLSSEYDEKSSVATHPEDSCDGESEFLIIGKNSMENFSVANPVIRSQLESLPPSFSSDNIEPKQEKHIRQDSSLREMSLIDEIAALKDNLEQQNAVLLRFKEDFDEANQVLVQKENTICDLQNEITTLQDILEKKDDENNLVVTENQTQTDIPQTLEINEDLENELEKLRHEKIQFLLKNSSQSDVVYNVKSQLQSSISHLISLKREASSQLKKQKAQVRDVIQVKRQLCESKEVISNLRNDLENKNEEISFIKNDYTKYKDKLYALQQKVQDEQLLFHLSHEKPTKKREHGSQTELSENIDNIKSSNEKDEPNLFQEGQSNLFPELLTKLRNMEALYFRSKEGSPESYDDSDDSELVHVKDQIVNGVKDRDWSKLLSISEEAYLNLVTEISKCLKLDQLKGSKLMSNSSLSVNEDIAMERKCDLQSILEALRAINNKNEFAQGVSCSDRPSPRHLPTSKSENCLQIHKFCSSESHCQCLQNALQDANFLQNAVKNSCRRKTSIPKSGKNERHISCFQRKIPLELKNAKILASLDKNSERK